MAVGTISGIGNRAVSNGMSPSKRYSIAAYTTTLDTYVDLATITTAGEFGYWITSTVATNDLLLKIQVSKEGVTYYTIMEDLPLPAGAKTDFLEIYSGQNVRVLVKPAVAGVHGTITCSITLSSYLIDVSLSQAFAYEALTITNAVAVGLTSATFDAARMAVITIEDNPIRIRWDGTAPTTSEGHLFQAGDSVTVTFSGDIHHFRAIATAGNAKLRVTYSR
jgi:hypothetical protein